ncbi:hypothetical protein BM1_02707 [Bipolaris maydis]|nr:hypothetical protein BM1_02707 [Bipolaris maydis]KAJ5030413.1 hypothetical protein J3E73DRAFT_404775 [Bipolaris maydis]KAJ6285973.1 hypothetical protein J3E71DRAFT_374368 [Bipolaris maydis]
MAEEFVELGFEGLDRFANRYWDRTYDHLPNIPRPRRNRYRQQQRQLPSGQAPQHPDKGYESSSPISDDVYGYKSDPEMYGPDRQDGYARDQRYREAEQTDYMHTAPGPGFRVPRRQAEYDSGRNTQLEPYGQAEEQGYNYGRPAPSRRRSSWSPPRSRVRGGSESRQVRSRSRSQSRPQSQLAHDDAKNRLIATIGGALVGGLAGNQVSKHNGNKYDTAATLAGAIIGGVGAREAADHWDKTRQKKKQPKGEGWEGEYGNGHGRRNERWQEGGRWDDEDRRY